MSYIVNTSVAPFCHSQNYSGGVPVPAIGVTTFGAGKYSRTKVEMLLGSREASRTCDRRVSRPNQHHRPTGAFGTHYEFSFGVADGRISRLARHRRLGQESLPKILHCDDLVSGNHTLRPYPGIVPRLTRGLLPQPGDLVFRMRATMGRCRPGSMTSGHSALRFREFGSTALAVPAIRKIVGGICGRCGRTNAPVDTDDVRHGRQRIGLALDYERGIPGSETILENSYAGRLTRQLSRPDNRNREALRQVKPTAPKPKPAAGVFQGRKARLAGFELGPSPTRNSEGFIQCPCVGTQSLLLSDLGTFTKPSIPTSSSGQQLAQFAERRLQPRLVLVHGLIPHEAAPVPLCRQLSNGDNPRADPVVVAHCFDHQLEIPRTTDMKSAMNEIPPPRVTDVSR